MLDMDKARQLCAELRTAADHLDKLLYIDSEVEVDEQERDDEIEQLLDSVIEECGVVAEDLNAEEEARLDAIRRQAAGLPDEEPETEEAAPAAEGTEEE